MSSFPAYTYEKARREVTIPIYEQMRKFHDKFPPTYQLVSAYFGFTGVEETKKTSGKAISANLLQTLKSESKGKAPQPEFI